MCCKHFFQFVFLNFDDYESLEFILLRKARIELFFLKI